MPALVVAGFLAVVAASMYLPFSACDIVSELVVAPEIAVQPAGSAELDVNELELQEYHWSEIVPSGNQSKVAAIKSNLFPTRTSIELLKSVGVKTVGAAVTARDDLP